MNSSAPTVAAASRICSAVASGRPNAMFSATVPGEQERLLRHDPHLRAQRAARDVAQVVAVDEHASGGRVVEARDELGHRRLAGAGGADQRDGLARRDVEAHVLERVDRRRILVVVAPPAGVGEGDVVESDLAADARQLDRVLAVGEGGAHVEQLEDLLQRRHPGLVGRVELRELLDRFEQVRERGHEGDDRAGRDVAFDRLQAAVHDDRGDRQPGEHFHAREVRGVELHGDVCSRPGCRR